MASGSEFTVEDALELVSISEPAWNDDGSFVGGLRFEDGETDFAAYAVGSIETTDVGLDPDRLEPDVRTETGGVSGFAWRPERPDEAVVVVEGDIRHFAVDEGLGGTIAGAREDSGPVAWGPDGDRLAYLRAGTLWVQDLETGGTRELTAPEDVPAAADFFGGTELEWDPEGRYLATVAESDAGTLGVVVFDTHDDTVAYRTIPAPREDCMRASFTWAAPGHLVYAEDSDDGGSRVYRSVRVGEDEDRGVSVASEHVDGLLLPITPVGNGDGLVAVVSARTGYRHIYAIDVETRREAGGGSQPGLSGSGVTQVTEGEFEARGDAADPPAWSEDGRKLAYAANPDDPGERQLYVATLEADGTVADIEGFRDVDGNALAPTWHGSERVGCIRTGRKTPADIHVADVTTGAVERVSASYPAPERLAAFPEPEPVSFPSFDGTEIYGYLYTPPDAEPGDDRPAIVLCHGGPIAQMRRGFNPGRTYGYFHLFNHVWVSQGYAVLALNFRSGIGYGREFEQGIQRSVGVDELQDCVRAAEFLREHELIGDRIGVWGRSYGGFLANHLATKADAYDCAVNIAGIWDWRTWEEWAIDLGPTHWGPSEPSWFHNRFEGPPDSDDPEVQERYRVASPSEYVDGMDTPLMCVHGTADKNVTVNEQDLLVRDLVAAGEEFEMAYYPEEEHMFEDPATWRDALDRIGGFFETHLK